MGKLGGMETPQRVPPGYVGAYHRRARRVAAARSTRWAKDHVGLELAIAIAFAVTEWWVRRALQMTTDLLTELIVAVVAGCMAWFIVTGLRCLLERWRFGADRQRRLRRIVADSAAERAQLLTQLDERTTWERGRREFERAMLAGGKVVGNDLLVKLPPAGDIDGVAKWLADQFHPWRRFVLLITEECCGPTGMARVSPQMPDPMTRESIRAMVLRMLEVLDELMREKGQSAEFYDSLTRRKIAEGAAQAPPAATESGS